METPVSLRTEGSSTLGEANGNCEESLSTLPDVGSQLICIGEGSVVVLDAMAAANLVCSRWLENRNSLLTQRGFRRSKTNPAKAPFKFGDGRMGAVRYSADTTVGVAGNGGPFTAFVLDSDIPAFLRKGASGAMGGQLAFPRCIDAGIAGR